MTQSFLLITFSQPFPHLLDFHNQKTDKNSKKRHLVTKFFFLIYIEFFATYLTTSNMFYKPILDQLKDDFSALASLRIDCKVDDHTHHNLRNSRRDKGMHQHKSTPL